MTIGNFDDYENLDGSSFTLSGADDLNGVELAARTKLLDNKQTKQKTLCVWDNMRSPRAATQARLRRETHALRDIRGLWGSSNGILFHKVGSTLPGGLRL